MQSLRALTAVFQREVMERRLLGAAALILGLVPLLMPLLPRVGSSSLSEMRSATALVLAGVFSAVIALMLGGSLIARDLAERRISFYFSRPLPGWTIWAGKLAAGAALVLGGAALVLVPVLLLGDKVDPSGYWGSNVAGTAESFSIALCALLVLLLVGHAVGVILRSRSPWLILDLTAFLVTGWLFLDSTHVLRVVGANIAANIAVAGILLALPLALLVAGTVQVTRGRTDLRRSHRLLSLTLWGILGFFALGAMSGSRWVTSAEPRDLETILVGIPAPAGDWTYVQGLATHRGDYIPAFLLNTSSGRSLQVTPFQRYPWGARSSFSADGRWAAWTYWNRSSPVAIGGLDLAHPEAGLIQTPIYFDSFVEDLALSPDGRRLATVVSDRLQVDEFPSGRMLASVPLPRKRTDRAWLLFGERAIRIYAQSLDKTPGNFRLALRIYEYDLATRQLGQTGEIDLSGIVSEHIAFEHLDRLVLRNFARQSVDVLDGRTGERMMSFPVERRTAVRAALLTGNRLALALQRRGRPHELLILAADGTPLRRRRFGGKLTLGGQPTPGTLVVAAQAGKRPGTSWLLDIDTGKLRRIGSGITPLTEGDWVLGANPPAGSLGTKLFVGDKGRLVWIDPASGRQRVVLPGQ